MRKAVAAGIAVGLFGAVAWFALRGEGPAEVPEGTPAAGVPATPAGNARAAGEPSRPAAAPPAAPDAPAPVAGPKATGRVTDREGKPVPGARVVSYPESLKKTLLASEAGTEGKPGRASLSAADGRFEVPVAAEDPFSALLVSAAGFADTVVGQVRAGDDVTVVLERAIAVAGRVLDMDAKPVAGARVRILTLVDAVRIEREGLSGADGVYRVEGVPPARQPRSGSWTFQQTWGEVTAAGFAPLLVEWFPATLMPRDAGGTIPYDFVLGRGVTVAGKVVEAGSGDPVPGARVLLWSIEAMGGFGRTDGSSVQSPWGPRPLQETKSAEDGSFRFERVPGQGAHPSSSHNGGRKGMVVGYVAAWKEGSTAATEEVPLSPEGAALECTLKLCPAATLSGRVLDSKGAPVAECWVYASREGVRFEGWVPEFYADAPRWGGQTDAAGRYRLAGVPVEKDVAVTVSVTGRMPVRGGFGYNMAAAETKVSAEVRAGATAEMPDLVLGAAEVARAVVIVTDEAGRPVWGATVGRDMGGGGWPRTDREGRTEVTAPLSYRDERTGEKKPFPPQAMTLTVRAKGLGPAAGMVTPSADVPPPELKIVLPVAHRLAGRVLEADGSPSKGTGVQVANGALSADAVFPETWGMVDVTSRSGSGTLSNYGYATTAEDGSFVLEDLPPGPCHVLAQRYLQGGGMGGPRTLRAVLPGVAGDTTDLVITLPRDDSPPAGDVEGAVTDAATGKPVWTFQAFANREKASVGAAPAFVSGGKFRIEGLPAGLWTLRVKASGYADFEQEVEVVPGAPAVKLAAAMSRGAAVAGRIREAGGTSLSGANVTFASESVAAIGGATWVSASLAADGSFRATGFKPGAYRMNVGMSTSGAESAWFLPQDGGRVVIEAAADEVRVDAVVFAAGALRIDLPQDPRLPPGPWAGGRATPEQERFGAAARLEIRDASGKVVRETTGLFQGYAGPLGYVILLPGDYVVRLELPGAEPREERAAVEAGKTAIAVFRMQ